MKEFLNNQYKNIFLWVPFVMAFGGALYFSLNTEPNFHFPLLITILLGMVIYKNKNIIIRATGLFLFGFFYAMVFTHLVNTPQTDDSFGAIEISGIVRDIEYTSDKTRLTLSIPMNQIDSTKTNEPVNVRISVSDAPTNINVGDTINGNALLFHPSEKYTPESFDFARWAYFAKISATGFFVDYNITKSNSDNYNFRTYIHNRANSFLTDSLVLGYKKTIPESESNIWKSVGLGHIWSISGFHMTLVGGWLFFIFYLIFRSIPYITKRIPAKYPAVICSCIGLFGYLCLSGLSVATIRAFLMSVLIGLALIFGRNVLSLRNGALVFLIIFLINPFYVMHPGFQLSFAAVFGLLWFFGNKEYKKRSFIARNLHIVYLSLMTTLIATVFTTPFIISHFGYIPLYGLIGNLILLPIFSILIMPLIIIATILTLFDYYAGIRIAHNVYAFTLELAKHITNLPYATINMPHISNFVLILCIVALLCLILIVKPNTKNLFIRHINYICFGFLMFTAIVIYIHRPRPLFYATKDHQLVAFNVNNHLQFNKSRASKHYFAFSSWYEFNNEIQPNKNKRYKCDHGFCKYVSAKWNLVYMQTFTALMNNIIDVCRDKNIDYVITPFNTNATNCHAKILNEGLMIYPNGHITRIINRRPWHNQHK